ncbi:hypothetical protein [Halobacterium noricense]|uniref:hypothetical protein n=1 Tax=Halobacterium noricense TaxID=223182 RepID=UPI001E34F2DA|nr:hypothetical protein [Halobacterium noricense]UHH27093.1 hypothetical protein LT974_15605 [Halobacterium noricense]
MIGFGTGMPVAHVIAILVGYIISGMAFYIYKQRNDRSMIFLGFGLASHSTTFLLPLVSTYWMEIPDLLPINYILLFIGYALIGYFLIQKQNA